MAVDDFSASYAEARNKFRAAVQAVGGQVDIYANPACLGPAGEELTCDVVRFGSERAERLLLLNTATHGIEGYCGSGSVIGLIRAGIITAPPAGTAIVAIHAINPYGFAWGRRVTEDNVDLNRNFQDFAAPLPVNDGYDALQSWLLPSDWDGPGLQAADAALADWIAAHGFSAFQAAVTGGQYRHADGLFYGGQKPSWSNDLFRRLVAQHSQGARQVGFIDFHTGLGPSGYGEPIYVGARDAAAGYARACAWYGPDVTWPEQGSSTSAIVTGTLLNGLRDGVPAETLVTGIALEYGTVPTDQVIRALRADNWLHARQGIAPSSLDDQGQAIKQAIRAAFYVETELWKQQVYDRAVEMVTKALAGLHKG